MSPLFALRHLLMCLNHLYITQADGSGGNAKALVCLNNYRAYKHIRNHTPKDNLCVNKPKVTCQSGPCLK